VVLVEEVHKHLAKDQEEEEVLEDFLVEPFK
jgi:hypothetical protein